MTKINIFSGFLGAGKTTLIKKLIKEAYQGEKLVLIENEFGEIGIDGGFLQDSGVEITEMNSGCICCSLVGDFAEALKKVLRDFAPDRILIEPSGVGKLSDVIRAVQNIKEENVTLNGYATIVDANKCKLYMKNFGEFFNDQIESAGCIVLSHSDNLPESRIADCVHRIRELNKSAAIVTTPWEQLSGLNLAQAVERTDTLEAQLHQLEEEACPVCGHHHHEHKHEHEHGHHHADDVFVSWGMETAGKYSKTEIGEALSALSDSEKFGMVLRAKGIVAGVDGNWFHFDYIPEEPEIREGSPGITGRLCVIGSNINNEKLAELFRL